MNYEGLSISTSRDVVARVDLARKQRLGMPEAIYAQSKTTQEVVAIVRHHLLSSGDPVIVTRCTDDVVNEIKAIDDVEADSINVFPDLRSEASYRAVVIGEPTPIPSEVVILTAGTSDLRVAYECKGTLFALGINAKVYADVGVAHVDRILEILPELYDFDVVVVVAGMEGALASVVGGLLPQPIVAVPTSAGYGSSFDGLTALLAMTASCAQGVSVMGIDNGFGAACAAFRVASRVSSSPIIEALS